MMRVGYVQCNPAFGEVARGWQAIAGGQATMEDRVAQLAIELAENAKDYPLILTKVLDEFSRA